MGLPDGWVTGPAHTLTDAQQLTALGNGVVPTQAAAAIRALQLATRSAVTAALPPAGVTS